MPCMEPGHEVESPTTDDSTPLPIIISAPGVDSTSSQPAAQNAESLPTPDQVLLWIAGSDGTWFPSRFASASGIPRDSLDEPLTELRLAGLVQVAEWVRGSGQGYIATAEGKLAATDAAMLAHLRRLVRSTTSTRAENGSAQSARGSEAETGENPPVRAPQESESAESSDDSRDDEVLLRPPLVVPALLIANSLCFFVYAVVSIRWGVTLGRTLGEGEPEVLARLGAVSGTHLLAGEWWRLLTSCFVHIGLLHLLGNMFALAMMGPLAELVWGRMRLVIIYFVSGLAGSALAMAIHPNSLLAGASGAIWGIQMSLFAWLFTFRRHLPPDLAADWFRRLGVVFVLNAGVSFLPGVSWEAHLGGGLAGFMTAGLLNAIRFGDRPRRIASLVLLILLPALCVGGVWVAMSANGTPRWQQLRQRLAADEERARLKRVEATMIAFKTEVAPLADQLAPEAVKGIDMEAGSLLKLENRSPERVSAVRGKVEALKKLADDVVTRTTVEPVGHESFDKLRERVRVFAAVRAKSCALLLAMLATEGVPKKEPWDAWLATRRDADRLWNELIAELKK